MSENDVRYIARGYVGSYDRNHVYVEMQLQSLSGSAETVMHDYRDFYLEFVMRGMVVSSSGNRIGQVYDCLLRITQVADGLQKQDIMSLYNLWKTWHLNSERGVCAHQIRIYDDVTRERPDMIDAAPCPITGQTYLSHKLVEPIPTNVIDEIFSLGNKINSLSVKHTPGHNTALYN